MMIKNNKGAQRAKRLLAEIGYEDVTGVSLTDIASFLGAVVIEEPMEVADGKIIKGKNTAIIKINSKIKISGKKRFALAHEIGHLLLHDNLEIHNDTAASNNWFQNLEDQAKRGGQEYEANDFAAELLMPETVFKSEFKGNFGPDLLKELSVRFQTSITSVIFRVFKLDLYPVCIFFTSKNKVHYWLKSEDFRVFVKNITKLAPPEDSVAAEYIASGYAYIYKGAQKAQQIERSTWFIQRSDELNNDFFEYCIPFKESQTVISLIWEK